MARSHQFSGRLALAAIAVTSALCVPAPGTAQTTSGRTALLDSYAAAMKCFAANGYARRMKLNAGDPAGAARYESGTRAAYGAASVIGVALGYSKTRMEADYAIYRSQELPRMVNDPAYFASTVTTCRALNLMPQP